MRFSFIPSLAMLATLFITAQSAPSFSPRNGLNLFKRADGCYSTGDYCGASTFAPMYNANPYPRTQDCRDMIWHVCHGQSYWIVKNPGWQHVAWWGTCSFKVKVNGNGGNGWVWIGQNDVRDIVSDVINKYNDNGQVGGEGGMSCTKADGGLGNWGISWQVGTYTG